MTDMFEISRQTHSIQYVDASPSELIHTFQDKILVHSIINFTGFDLDLEIRQFKDTRRERKSAMQQRIITAFEAGRIMGCGVITPNSQLYAMENARKFLVDAGILPPGTPDLTGQIEFEGQTYSIGVFLSLTWYAICLALSFQVAAIFSTVEKKNKVFIALDMLPGDNEGRPRSLNVIKGLIRNTWLRQKRDEATQRYRVAIGYGYAANPETGDPLKTEAPLCVCDWITRSFYARLRRDNVVADAKQAELNPYTLLAEYLEKSGSFKAGKAFRFTDEI
jgi:hypothetical protein